MDTIFLANNTHWQNAANFASTDPHLINLNAQRLIYEHRLLDELPTSVPGIYTLGGGRQIGKTTLLKQWMARCLEKGVPAKSMVFISGEVIDDHHALIRVIQSLLKEMEGALKYLIIDEITYIKAWDKAIKYLADIRLFHNVIVILTGSDLTLIKQARMTFPGRRGKAAKVNFHLYPLSFREYFQCVNSVNVDQWLEETSHIDQERMAFIYDKFQEYLLHGGFLTAMNDLAAEGRILEASLTTYAEWIRGDMLKRGKSETYLREIFQALIKRYGNQLSWNAVADAISIDHPNTVADYCHLLQAMDALFIQAALLEDKLTAAPKKARKLIFTDPFIFHAIHYWLNPVDDPYENQMQRVIHDPEMSSKLVEACIATHYKRFYPTYYIKAAGEIDIAYIDNNRFWPIEIKWRNQLRPKDVKQIAKYKNARIFSRVYDYGRIENIPIEPLPLALLALDGDVLID